MKNLKLPIFSLLIVSYLFANSLRNDLILGKYQYLNSEDSKSYCLAFDRKPEACVSFDDGGLTFGNGLRAGTAFSEELHTFINTESVYDFSKFDS
jgi:hypothetical protein